MESKRRCPVQTRPIRDEYPLGSSRKVRLQIATVVLSELQDATQVSTMKRHVREQEVEGVRMPPPHAREVKHLAAPWTMGTKNLWMGISQVEPNSRSNRHSHPHKEEVFFVLSGEGRITVAEEEFEVGEGSCVYVPTGEEHQLVNTQSDEVLRVLSVTSPPFTFEDFVTVHTPK